MIGTYLPCKGCVVYCHPSLVSPLYSMLRFNLENLHSMLHFVSLLFELVSRRARSQQVFPQNYIEWPAFRVAFCLIALRTCIETSLQSASLPPKLHQMTSNQIFIQTNIKSPRNFLEDIWMFMDMNIKRPPFHAASDLTVLQTKIENPSTDTNA